jgi:hypothetical protein
MNYCSLWCDKIPIKFCLIAIASAMFISLLLLSDNALVNAGTDRALNMAVSHSGKGEAEICLKNEGYNSLCDDYDLTQESDPLVIPVDVEDAEVGDNFEVCYEFRDIDNEVCNDFSFSGQSPQLIELSIDNTTIPLDTSNNGVINETPELPPALPPIPPMS